ncbi:MAG: pyridoxamine 5'-phosphate oxidase family protein [Candidatus Dormibacteraeota bacterium]|nr:pyridoxamine 5'-phosphate oxidase family protein [Candidatus Dormibacteraeota bacterium]
MADGQGTVETMASDEALELLQRHGFVGRVAFIVDGRPMMMPVNYLADAESLVFCTAEGTKLSALRSGASVCFEVDDSRPFDHSGWSVIVEGTASEVTDPGELEWLHRGPLRSWAVQPSSHWIRIQYEHVSGRRIRAH